MKPSFSALWKYDVTQKVFETLADAQSRAILFSTIKVGKTTVELVEEHRIPLSSVYKKVSELESLGLVKVDKVIISDRGKKFKVYQSKISKAEVTIDGLKPIVNLSPNPVHGSL